MNSLPAFVLLLTVAFASGVRAGPGDVDTTFNPRFAGRSPYSVESTVVQPDGKIVLCGQFYDAGIVRLNPDGTPDPFFDAISGASCTAVQADGKIVIGGYGMARLNADGTLDVGFNPDPKVLTVGSIGMQADGKILIAGELASVGGPLYDAIARLNADGSLDASFNPNPGQSVRCMAVQADGKILIGGSLNGTNSIARLNVDGTRDTGFNFTGSISYGSVTCIAIQTDGKLIIGGNFTSVGGAARNYLARLNADGTLDAGFNPNLGRFSDRVRPGTVYSAVVQTDGKMIILGLFNVGATRAGLARLNADGSLDAGFNPDQGIQLSTASIAIQTDGKVLIGGYFTNVAGMARDHVARLLNDDAIQKLAVPSASRIEWLRGGASPEVQSVVFELSTNLGTTMECARCRNAHRGWLGTNRSQPARQWPRARPGARSLRRKQWLLRSGRGGGGVSTECPARRGQSHRRLDRERGRPKHGD